MGTMIGHGLWAIKATCDKRPWEGMAVKHDKGPGNVSCAQRAEAAEVSPLSFCPGANRLHTPDNVFPAFRQDNVRVSRIDRDLDLVAQLFPGDFNPTIG